ncbi:MULTISPECIES: universal stress protein [Burkholderiaceae]|jgi:nucleotide-binding universal stress UspA family protein|uniref:Universal stress protein n=1 Tax=Burkholderia vietnamiensis TaxID=60552 RepID=A0AAW7TCB2_BURVI|nr:MULTISPECIES: universal stress protein [Burkholderiaceae]MDN7799441.1 universal stress protein [Burkholderia vietnamiensis]RFU44253.1 universal stress protein [Paraburkholderia sp. DHOC27]
MSYKDILVFLDAGRSTATRLDLAVSLCQRFDARLVGVDVSTPDAFAGEFADVARGLESMFETKIKESSIRGEYRVAETRTSSWKDFYAHYADLVVATERDETSDDLVAKGIPDDIVMSAGVPVLILPSIWGPGTIGESVVVAWNSSRESTRALHDALPILKQATRVTIFEFAPFSDHVDSAPGLVQAHLKEHGVESEIFTWPDVKDVSPIDALFSCLDRQQADLIVAGAFGHPRLIEAIFGSASEDLLHNPSIPVLISH